jgi:hypothetical protein
MSIEDEHMKDRRGDARLWSGIGDEKSKTGKNIPKKNRYYT